MNKYKFLAVKEKPNKLKTGYLFLLSPL